VLFRLVTATPDLDHEVICLGPREWFSSKLEERGVRVHHVEAGTISAALAALYRLYSLIRASGANVVQGWMYRGNVFGGLASRFAGKPVVWNVRCSDIHLYPSSTRALARLGGVLARWVPKMVLNCSTESHRQHARIGYSAAPSAIIPNGYDAGLFHPDESARAATRNSLGLGSDTFVIGTIGRWDTRKAYPLLLQAVGRLAREGIAIRLLLLGRGLDSSNSELARAIAESGCAGFVDPVGYRDDIADVARAIDVHILASFTEGFPNVVAETMLSGTPNIVTDAGDAALIAGPTGWVVAPGDGDALAAAIRQAHDEWRGAPASWALRREAVRQRIEQKFSLARMAEAYKRVWGQVAARGGQAGT
jgi:glycosyltransferase involved in cell wall biosynthesis